MGLGLMWGFSPNNYQLQLPWFWSSTEVVYFYFSIPAISEERCFCKHLLLGQRILLCLYSIMQSQPVSEVFCWPSSKLCSSVLRGIGLSLNIHVDFRCLWFVSQCKCCLRTISWFARSKYRCLLIFPSLPKFVWPCICICEFLKFCSRGSGWHKCLSEVSQTLLIQC